MPALAYRETVPSPPTMVRSTTTIEDIYLLALPQGTQLLEGEEFLGRAVTWACSLRPSPPAFPKLDGNEVALIDMNDLRQLDPKIRLDRVVRSLHNARIAAIAVLGEVPATAVETAQSCRLPLFQLPDDAGLLQVERTIIRLIVDRAGYIAQRSAELQRELNQVALDNGGLVQIAQHIQRFAQQPLLMLREDGQLAASAGLEDLPESRQHSVLRSLPNIMSLRTWAATQRRTDITKAFGALPLAAAHSPADFRQAVVAPIVVNDSVRGYCLLLRATGNGQDVTAVEEIAVTQGATVAALEWAKQNAVDVAQERMRATFVDELLAAEIADEQAWIQRGTSLGFILTRPHVAWMIEVRDVPDWPAPLLRFINERQLKVPLSKREEGLLLYWPSDNPKSGRDLKAVATELVERLQAVYPRARAVIGIGRPASGPSQWLQSLQQARESWRLGKDWQASPITYFGDLGLYQLLTALGGNPEAARFFRRTLGRLISHDDNRSAELVDTLDAFFECHGNLSQTANRLHIHRNTLTYRLERIATITQMDLDDPDARFSLQLALKLRPVMR